MGRRVARLLVLSALVVGLVGAQGMSLASGEEDHPVGYTIGQPLPPGTRAFCSFFKIDLTTGETTRLDPAGVQCGDGLTFDDDGTLYAYRNPSTAISGPGELITIDKDDGAQHVVGQLPTVAVGGGGMTFDAEGHLWLYAQAFSDPQCTPTGTYCLWKVNPKNGHTQFVGAAPFARGVFGLAADCEDVLAITVALTGEVTQVRLDEVDTDNAALSIVTDLPGVGFPSGLDFGDDDNLWALATTPGKGSGIGATVYKVDPDNGNADPRDMTIGGVPLQGTVNGLAVDPISCDDPEHPAAAPQPVPVVLAPTFTG
jgi:sugar lactone lactonase YvrE